MITSKTKQIAIVSGVVLITMCVATFVAIRIIIAETAELSQQVAAIAVDQSQQTAFTRLQKLLQETEGDRNEVRSYYLASQSDSIDFLNYIEQLGKERGIALETINPTEIEREGKTYLEVEYSITGGLNQVESFIKLLENIPYMSQLQSVRLQKRSGVVWEADVMIEVAVLTYESSN